MLYYILLATLLISTIVAGFNTPISGVPYDATYAMAAHTLMALSYLGLYILSHVESTITRRAQRRAMLARIAASKTKTASGNGAVFFRWGIGGKDRTI